MFKRTKFFVGISLLTQALTCICTFVVLAFKKKSLWKAFLALGAASGVAGGYLTISALKSDRKFKKVLKAVDELCAPDDEDYEPEAIPTDETACEDEFE